MYNWESCKVNGVPIVSLRLNGYLVWEKRSGAIIYYGQTATKATALGIADSLTIPSEAKSTTGKTIELIGDGTTPNKGWFILLPEGTTFVHEGIIEQDEIMSDAYFDRYYKGTVTIDNITYDYYAQGGIASLSGQKLVATIN